MKTAISTCIPAAPILPALSHVLGVKVLPLPFSNAVVIDMTVRKLIINFAKPVNNLFFFKGGKGGHTIPLEWSANTKSRFLKLHGLFQAAVLTTNTIDQNYLQAPEPQMASSDWAKYNSSYHSAAETLISKISEDFKKRESAVGLYTRQSTDICNLKLAGLETRVTNLMKKEKETLAGFIIISIRWLLLSDLVFIF